MTLLKILRPQSIVALALALLVPSVVYAAGEQNGRISGNVTEAQTGAPVPGATVSVSSRALIGGARNVTSGDDGHYELVELPPGKYDVEVSYSGVKPIKRRVVVRQGETVPLDIAWSAELAETEVTVVVEERHMTRPDSTQSGVVISADTESKIALNRRYQAIANQAAGTVATDGQGAFQSIKGGLDLHNRYLVDGMDITDPVTNTWSANINFDSVASEEVLTGGMEAQYNSLGGVINLITNAGSDEWHVDSSLYISNAAFAAPARYGNQFYNGARQFDNTAGPPNEKYQANINVGGPILKHRLWWNASIEYLFEKQAQPVGSPLNIQHPAFIRHQVLARLKLTWAPNDKHRLSLSISSDPAFLNNFSGNFEGLANYERGVAEDYQSQGGMFTVLQWDYFHSQNINTTVQAGFQWQELDHGPQGIYGTNDFGPGCPNAADPKNCTYDPNRARHSNIFDNTSWYQGGFDSRDTRYTVTLDPTISLRGKLAGSHDAKIGIQSRYVYHAQSYHTPGQWQYTDGGLTGNTSANQNLQKGLCNEMAGMPGVDAINCYQRSSVPDSSSHQQGLGVGLFVQDRWKPFKRLTVLPGIRFDYGWTANTAGKTVSSLFGVGPRLGFALDLTGDQKTIWSAAYGRANETLSLLAASNTDNPYQTTEQWNPKTGRWEPFSSSGGPAGTLIGGNLQPPHTDEFTTALRREIFKDSVAGLEYTYKRISNIWDGIEQNQVWDPSGYRVVGYSNGEARQIYLYSTPDRNYRIYQGIDFTVESRPTPNWDLWAAYTVSWLYGPGAEQLGQVTGVEAGSSQFYNPRQRAFYDGFLAEDHRHNLKLRASYSWKGLTVGAFFNYVSGSPLTKKYFNAQDGGYTNSRSPQGTEPGVGNDFKRVTELRLPDIVSMDTRVEYDFHSLIKQHIIVMVDLFNMFNLAQATGLDNTDTGTYGTAQGRQTPFRLQLGVRYNY